MSATPLRHGRSLARPAAWIVAGWGSALLLLTAQAWVAARLQGGSPPLPRLFLDVARHLVVWAAATPAVLASARRWPVRGPAWTGSLVRHLAAGAAFVVLLNVAVRVPPLGAVPPAAWTADLLAGLARWGHLALLVYLALVALGHLTAGPTPRTGIALRQERGLPEPSRPSDRADVSTPPAPAGPSPAAERRLSLRTARGTVLLAEAELDWVAADGNHLRVGSGGRVVRVRGTLAGLEARLDPERFVRVHRSYLVSLAAVREVLPGSHGDRSVVLVDGTELPVARTRAAALEALLLPRREA